jgi:hypothetical protein
VNGWQQVDIWALSARVAIGPCLQCMPCIVDDQAAGVIGVHGQPGDSARITRKLRTCVLRVHAFLIVLIVLPLFQGLRRPAKIDKPSCPDKYRRICTANRLNAGRICDGLSLNDGCRLFYQKEPHMQQFGACLCERRCCEGSTSRRPVHCCWAH